MSHGRSWRSTMVSRIVLFVFLWVSAMGFRGPGGQPRRLLGPLSTVGRPISPPSSFGAEIPVVPPPPKPILDPPKKSWVGRGLGLALLAGVGTAVFRSGAIAIDGAVLGASAHAMSKLVVCIGLGAMLAGPGKPLDSAACRSLSRLIYFLFLPMLLVESVATTIVNAGSLKEALPLLALPGFALAQIGCGAFIGAILIKALRWRRSGTDSRQLMICSAFGNSGPLPMIIADAFLRTQGDPTMVTTAIGYISLYLLGWSPAFWTFANMLAEPPKKEEAQHVERARERKSFVGAAIDWLQSPWGKRLASPPIIACTAGILLGTVPFLKQAFLAPDAILSPVTEAVRTIGRGYLPCVLLVLAGSIASRPKSSKSDDVEGKEERTVSFWEKRKVAIERKRRVNKVAAVMLGRFCFLPLIVFSMLSGATQLGLVAASNQLLRFVLLLEACMPCAQNSVVVLQIIGDKKGASEMGKVVAAIYLLSLIPMTVLVSAVIARVGFV